MVAKHCTKCGIGKPASEFFKHATGKLGLHPSCKSCCKLYVRPNPQRDLENARAWTLAHPEKRATIIAKYNDTHRAEQNERSRAYRKTNKAARAQTTARYKAEHPDRYAAKCAVQVAVANGSLLPQPCCECGCTKAEAHHSSYARDMWLVVTWLCRKHHAQLHREVRSWK